MNFLAHIFLSGTNEGIIIGNFIADNVKGKAYKLGLKASIRFDGLTKYFDEPHKRILPGAHWYLQALGVSPEFQGQGYGTNLLGQVFSHLDVHNLPYFLETPLEIDVKFYQRVGFEVRDNLQLKDQNINLWFMVREPLGS